MSQARVYFFFILANLSGLTWGHVSLTFPPARNYDLDFLDIFKTKQPCGMPKGSVKTTIPNDRSVTITWHLGYPHTGGFSLTLYDKDGNKVSDLTPAGQFQGTNNKNQQSYSASLPSSLECKDCYIRLLREAKEWDGANSAYQFQSCADVDIVKASDFTEDCTGKGTLESGSCKCEKTYYGDRCQFKNDCDDDTDCNSKGKCLAIPQSTTQPNKQCFCLQGHFGFNCEKASSFKNEGMTFNASAYEQVSLGSNKTFYWRYVDESKVEFEGVITADTKSFLAVGWRPKDTTKSCHSFPSGTLGYNFGLHGMDCNDIVLGSVRNGNLFRIEDYYTRDRSTPRPDKFYGGSSDLTGALGWEKDGQTVLMFRKKVKPQGSSDHEFKGELKLVWAHGQTGVEFYHEDELKYHGGNRGVVDLVVGKLPLSRERKLLIAALIVLAVVLVVQIVANLNKFCNKR